MKSQTRINKMIKEQVTSIHEVELLNRSLHREGKLSQTQVVRFRPLFGDFDLVNADYFQTGAIKTELCKPIGTIENLEKCFA